MERLTYIGASLSAMAYAAMLEIRPLKYHPDVVWPNVAGGIALTGAWVAIRFACERQPRSLWWAWREMFLMFCATGIPVISWEQAAKSERGRTLLAYVRGRHGYPAPPAGEQGKATGADRS